MRKGLRFLAIHLLIFTATAFFILSCSKEEKTVESKKVETSFEHSKANPVESHAAVKAKSLEKIISSESKKENSLKRLKNEPAAINLVGEENESDEEYEAKEESKRERSLESEREKHIEDGKADRPDLFAQYQVGIRTRVGETKPAYKMNYQVNELMKARASFSNSLGKAKAVLPWIERGPGNVSGRTRGIVVDPDDATFNTWYAGSVGGGVWKTTDAGGSWALLTTSFPNMATSTIAMAESNHDVMYVGTGEGFGNADQIDGSGIWKTTDRGVTWNQVSGSVNNPNLQNITRLIIDPADENTLLVSAAPGFYYNASNPAPSSGIFRSTDGGTNWTKVYDAENNVEHLIANPENFNTQYAAINGVGVIKSYDGGITWSDASNGIGPVLRMEIAIAPSDTNTVYLSAEGGVTGSILYISDDGGNTWFGANDEGGNDANWLGGQGWYDNTIIVDPYDKNNIYVGGVSIFNLQRTAGTDTSDEQVKGVDLQNTSSFLGFVNWGGPYNSGSIGTGDDFLGSVGVTNSDFVSVEIRFGPGMTQKAYRFVRNGATGVYEYVDYIDVPFEVWDITNNQQISFSFRDWADNGVFDLIAFDPNNIQREYMFVNAVPYSTTADTSIAQDNGFLNENIYAIWPILADGGTWNPSALPASVIRINWGTFITKRIVTTVIADVYGQFGGSSKGVHPDQHNILLVKTNESTQSFRMIVGNDGGVYYSDDKGNTFTNANSGYNTTQFYGVDKMNGADRYIGGTQDNGSWVSPLNPTSASVWSDAPSGDGFQAVWKYDDPDQMLESSQYNNIFKTTDGGASWANVSSGAIDQGGGDAPFFTQIAKSKQDPDLVFAVGASGVWRSDDFAGSWTLTPMAQAFNGASFFSRIKISLANPQVVWAGQSMAAGDPIYVSTDGGLSFDAASVYPTVLLGRISNIETHPIEDSAAYALFSFADAPKILKTTDLGQTWTDISGFGTGTTSTNGFPDVAVYSLLVMPYDTDIIWAGTEIGIFESTDGGASWAYANNGLPAVGVYEMIIVNDEVIAATHGRGIWTASIPQLSGYEPPAAVLSPRLSPIAQNPQGSLVIPFTLRSGYDSSHVEINGETVVSLDANTSEADSTIFYPVIATRTDSIQIIAYKNGETFKSYLRTYDSKLLSQPQTAYVTDFDTIAANFAGEGFEIDTAAGFSTKGIHSPHPYDNNTNNTYQLLIPIIVASSPNANLSYDDVAIVEPGDPGSVFGDSDFWDYVIVEATKDGINWMPLLDGYDARFDPDWLNTYNSSGSGNSSLYVNHNVNILNTFDPGDTILIRFRLFADGFTNGWGWAIDNLNIQGTTVGIAGEKSLPETFELSQNYPNPFNPTTTIKFQLPSKQKVTLEIFNTLGQKVITLIDELREAGYYQTVWNGTNSKNNFVASGAYFYRLEAGDFVVSKKMIFLK